MSGPALRDGFPIGVGNDGEGGGREPPQIHAPPKGGLAARRIYDREGVRNDGGGVRV